MLEGDNLPLVASCSTEMGPRLSGHGGMSCHISGGTPQGLRKGPLCPRCATLEIHRHGSTAAVVPWSSGCPSRRVRLQFCIWKSRSPPIRVSVAPASCASHASTSKTCQQVPQPQPLHSRHRRAAYGILHTAPVVIYYATWPSQM